MDPVEYDVFVCASGSAGGEWAREVADGLTGRGFRVCGETRVPGAQAEASRLRLIEDTPDFVLLLTPDAWQENDGVRDPVRLETAHALSTGRNVVPIAAAAGPDPRRTALPPGFPLIPTRQTVAYDPQERPQSLALLAHRLSSDEEVDDRRLVRRVKRLFIAAILGVVVGVTLQALPSLVQAWKRPRPKPPLPPLTLYWAGFWQRLDHGQWIELPLADGARVAGGDQLRLVFASSANGYAYVLSKDRHGDITVLFPKYAVRGASPVRAGQMCDAPTGGGWLSVDAAAGIDSLYLLASYDPIENLEEVVGDPEVEANPAARRELLELTLAGLIDGRQGVAVSRVWTRSGQTIDRSIKLPPIALSASVTTSGGLSLTRPLVAQPGLIHAAVQLRFQQ
ncbi:MAG TPA: DUF4384 domain-containing protein [Vicinamibacterales bacterium]|jgi:hypothetical protein